MSKYEDLMRQTGLSMSTIYRRIRKGYTEEEIKKEAKLIEKYSKAGSNWKKLADKEKQNMNGTTKEATPVNDLSLLKESKEIKRAAHWEPSDDYGLVSRLKVLGGWIVKIETEVLFVHDPKHKWEV